MSQSLYRRLRLFLYKASVVVVLTPSVLMLSCQTDNSGRLKLETVDDLFNILQLKKRRRERKIHKKKQPEPETVVRLQPPVLCCNDQCL